MEGKLHEAAIAGDVIEIDRLIKEYPEILEVGAAEETPLHIAAQLGHTLFVAKIGILKPEFAHSKNYEGRCPLHLASAKGHVETVAKLLEINSDVCFVRDRDGRTPLHIAAMKGRIQVLEKLAEKKIKAAWVLADCGQPILHLCANHNQFDALKLIIERVKDKAPEKLVEFVNLKDDDDNTILHLLAAKAQYQVIELLFPKDQSKNVFKVNVNAINQQGSTALDVLHQNCGPLDRRRIKFLLGEGAKRATNIPGSKSNGIIRHMWDSLFERKNAEKSETRDSLMVVAILIATVTFQAQINPPGGVWQQDGTITRMKSPSNETEKGQFRAGQSVMAVIVPSSYSWFIHFNIIGFVASLVLILLLVSGFTLRRKVSTLALTVTTWIAIMSLSMTFGVSLSTLRADHNRDYNVSICSVNTTTAPSTSPAPPSTSPAPPLLPRELWPSTTAPVPHSMEPTGGFSEKSFKPEPTFKPAGFLLLVPLMILLMLTLLIVLNTRSVKRGFKRLFCCPCFWKSSERDSEGRTDMNA